VYIFYIQIFKILALNCLCSAYMMSALYLRGLKQGDYQMTAAGLVNAGLFFFLSQSKPMSAIAPYSPPATVFSKSVLVSIIGQFFVHLGSLLIALRLSDYYMDVQLNTTHDDSGNSTSFSVNISPSQFHRRYQIPDQAFHPNLMNSTVYILSVAIQTANFVVNYRGEPFTQNLANNPMLFWSIKIIYGTIALVLSGVFDPLNDLLQLDKFPCLEYQYLLALIVVLDFGSCWLIEKYCQKLEVPVGLQLD
jgi:cation-transporting ATPase 13A1